MPDKMRRFAWMGADRHDDSREPMATDGVRRDSRRGRDTSPSRRTTGNGRAVTTRRPTARRPSTKAHYTPPCMKGLQWCQLGSRNNVASRRYREPPPGQEAKRTPDRSCRRARESNLSSSPPVISNALATRSSGTAHANQIKPLPDSTTSTRPAGQYEFVICPCQRDAMRGSRRV